MGGRPTTVPASDAPGTVDAMARLRPYPVTVFCAVTLLIWVNRIWLTWTNGTDSVGAKVLWSIPIGAFVAAAAVLVVAMLSGVDRDAPWFRLTVQLFAAGTVVYWAIRMPMIAFNDHGLTPSEEIAFKIVHSVLAIASVSSAYFAWRWARNASGEQPADVVDSSVVDAGSAT